MPLTGKSLFLLLLLIGLSTSVPVTAQTTFQFDKLDELVAFAKVHKKLVDKQYKEAQGKENKANLRANYDRSDYGPEFYSAYVSEVYSYRVIKDSLEIERGILELIDQISRYRFSDREVFSANVEATRYAGAADVLRERAEQQEGDALVNFRNAEVRKANPKIIVILRKGLETSKGVYGYFDQQEATVNRFLSVCCQTTISEIVARRAAAQKAKQEAFNRWMNQRESSREAGAAILIGLGLFSTLSRILSSTDATPEQLNYARQRMRELNEQARINCALRGGMFFGGDDTSFGTCSK